MIELKTKLTYVIITVKHCLTNTLIQHVTHRHASGVDPGG